MSLGFLSHSSRVASLPFENNETLGINNLLISFASRSLSALTFCKSITWPLTVVESFALNAGTKSSNSCCAISFFGDLIIIDV